MGENMVSCLLKQDSLIKSWDSEEDIFSRLLQKYLMINISFSWSKGVIP